MEEQLTQMSSEVSQYWTSLIHNLPKIGIAVVILLLFWTISKIIGVRLGNRISRTTGDRLFGDFIRKIIQIVAMTIGLLLALNTIGLGNIAAGVWGTAGIGAFIIGFAFKDIGEHFLAGFILAFKRPFRVGDLVELSGQKGTVVALDIRSTHIKTFDGRDIYIPNGNIIKTPLTNYTIDGFMRNDFVIGIDYDSDPDEAMEIIKNSLATIPGILTEEKKPSVAISDLTASTLNLTAYYWIDTFDKTHGGVDIKNKAIKSCLTALTANGFYLPGNIVELKNYNNSSLHQKSL